MVILDDAEYLLHEGERRKANLLALLESAHIRYAHRGLIILASVTDEEQTDLNWEIWRRRP
jgi:hypothetical protein